jgi:hypothetical protein
MPSGQGSQPVAYRSVRRLPVPVTLPVVLLTGYTTDGKPVQRSKTVKGTRREAQAVTLRSG